MDRLLKVLVVLCALALGSGLAVTDGESASDPAPTWTYPVSHPQGLMVTSGGWAYCEQVRQLARDQNYTLLCGRYVKDGYLGPGLRRLRHEDWGNPAYLARFAEKIQAAHRRVGGKLVLIGVSYSGFGVATLASHHPEIRPDELFVVDSYLDLVARRAKLPDTHETAREIDAETGGSLEALRQRSVGVAGLARLVRSGTRLTVVWSVSPGEQHFFNGATCDRTANARTLARLAETLHYPIRAWVTEDRHGVDLWRYGGRLLQGRTPGRPVTFRADGVIPPGSVCPG